MYTKERLQTVKLNGKHRPVLTRKVAGWDRVGYNCDTHLYKLGSMIARVPECGLGVSQRDWLLRGE